MKRTTVFLEPGVLRRARALARQRGVSFAQVVREALLAYLAPASSPAGPAPGPLARLSGAFASGTTDTAERVDELLWRERHG